MGLIMESVTINPSLSLDRVTVLKAGVGGARRPSRRFIGRFASLAWGIFSSDLLNSRLHTDVARLQFLWFYIVWDFQKQTLTGKGV